MKGYVAVQKKLLVMMYYLLKKNERYNPVFGKIIAPDKAEATRDELPKEILIK